MKTTGLEAFLNKDEGPGEGLPLNFIQITFSDNSKIEFICVDLCRVTKQQIA